MKVPKVSATVTPNTATEEFGDNGINRSVNGVYFADVVTTMKNGMEVSTLKTPGMTFSADESQSDRAFKFCWVQVINAGATKVGDSSEKVQKQLDKGFPYSKEPKTWDNPGFGHKPTVADANNHLKASRSADFTMYLMCQPVKGGIWVPVAICPWSVSFSHGNNGTPQLCTFSQCGHTTLGGGQGHWKAQSEGEAGILTDSSPAFQARFPQWHGVH